MLKLEGIVMHKNTKLFDVPRVEQERQSFFCLHRACSRVINFISFPVVIHKGLKPVHTAATALTLHSIIPLLKVRKKQVDF